jgi:hypothetical protein
MVLRIQQNAKLCSGTSQLYNRCLKLGSVVEKVGVGFYMYNTVARIMYNKLV